MNDKIYQPCNVVALRTIRCLSILVLLFFLSATQVSYAQQSRGMKRIVVRDPMTDETFTVYDRMWLLAVGINQYKYWPQLRYATHDAQEVTRVIQERFGVQKENTYLLTDAEATLPKIKAALGEFINNTEENDAVIIYFAGHGGTFTTKEGVDIGYLIPVEGRVESENYYASSIPMSEVKTIVNLIPAKHILFLVDACYSGLAAEGEYRGFMNHEMRTLIKKFTDTKSRHIIAAGSKNELVQEKEEWRNHSAFTDELLFALENGMADWIQDGIITADELGEYLTTRVSLKTKTAQTPQSRKLTSDEGKFVFVLQEEIGLPKNSPLAGTVSVTSNPLKADVYLDGKRQGETPITLSDIREGKHDIILRKDGYLENRNNIEIVSGKLTPINGTLVRPATLTLNSEPDGADIFINNQPYGKTPRVIPNLFPEAITVRLESSECSPFQEVVMLSEGEVTERNVRLKKNFGFLTITSEPPNSDVYINGDYFGTTPLRDVRILASNVNVVIRRDDYTPWEEQITIEPEGSRTRDIRLESSVGFLTLDVSPEDTEIKVDGKSIGTGSIVSNKIPVGHHELEFVSDTYGETRKEMIQIEPGKTVIVRSRFGVFTSDALWRSALLPGLGQLNKGNETKGYGFVAGFSIAGIYSIIILSDYLKKNNAFEDSKRSLALSNIDNELQLTAEVSSRREDLENSSRRGTVAIWLVAGVYALNLVDAVLFHSSGSEIEALKEGKDFTIYPSLKMQTHAIVLSAQWQF